MSSIFLCVHAIVIMMVMIITMMYFDCVFDKTTHIDMKVLVLFA